MKQIDKPNTDTQIISGARIRRKLKTPAEKSENTAALRNNNITDTNQTITDTNQACTERIFCWSEAFKKLGIKTIDIPWNATGTYALKLLRETYGDIHPCLLQNYLDEACQKCLHLCNDEQLNTLGEILQNEGLRFGFIAINPDYYRSFLVKELETRVFQKLWFGILSRTEFFSYVHLFSRSRENKSFLDIRMPIEQIQLHSRVTERLDTYPKCEKIHLLDKFLIVPKPIASKEMPLISLDIYDLSHGTPEYINDVENGFDPDYIQPYFCRFKTSSGIVTEFRGCDFSHLRELKSLRVMTNDEPHVVRHGISLDNESPETIPDVMDAEPFITYKNHIIYRYKRSDEQENRERHIEATLLDYDVSADKWRISEMPNFSRCHLDSLLLFKSQSRHENWILIPNGSFNYTSYSFRVWNPITNRCFRMPDFLMGKHQVLQFIPYNNDLYMFLDDGRLIRYLDRNRPFTDIVSFLSENKNCDLNLSVWSNEYERRYDNFDESDRNRQMRIQKFMSQSINPDRYIVHFNDDEEVEICISMTNI